MAGKDRFGSDLGLIHEMLILGRKVGADRVFWKTLSQDEGMLRRMVGMVNETVMAAKASKTSGGTYRVIVDYTKSLADMVAAGKYDSWDVSITSKNFPFSIRPREEVEIRLVRLGRFASTDEVMAEFDRMGLRPATLRELVSLGLAYPDLQRKFCMVALASNWRDPAGRTLRPILSEVDGKRKLSLDWDYPDGRWHADNRFAAVPK